jgi:hypothetical protein
VPQNGGTKPCIEICIATYECNFFLLFEISKRPCCSLPKHDIRMLLTYLVEYKNILYYIPDFWGNKRFDYFNTKEKKVKNYWYYDWLEPRRTE